MCMCPQGSLWYRQKNERISLIEREPIKEEQYEIWDEVQEEHIYLYTQSLGNYGERAGYHSKQRETFWKCTMLPLKKSRETVEIILLLQQIMNLRLGIWVWKKKTLNDVQVITQAQSCV